MTEAQITIEDYQIPNTESIIKIANIVGQLDESNVDEKIKVIYTVIEQVPSSLKLLLNFEGLDYMNSKSIGYLTDIYGKVMKGSGIMVIANAKENITDILQVVGLTQLVKTFSTSEEAKQYLANNTAAQVLLEPETPTPPATPATPPSVQVETQAPAPATVTPAPTQAPAPAPATPVPAPEAQSEPEQVVSSTIGENNSETPPTT